MEAAPVVPSPVVPVKAVAAGCARVEIIAAAVVVKGKRYAAGEVVDIVVVEAAHLCRLGQAKPAA